MRRVLAMSILAFLTSAAVAVSATQNVRILADRVDVRSYSSPEAPTVGSVAKGTVLEVLAREGDWLRIAIPESGYKGFVPLVYCEFVQAGTPTLQAPAPPPAPAQAPAPIAPRVAPAPVVTVVPPPPPAPPVEPPASSEVITSGDARIPKVELSVGYSYLHADWLGDTEAVTGSIPFGLVLAANFNLNRWLGIVVDLGGHYKSEEVLLFGRPYDLGLAVGSLHGGLRFSGHGSSGVTPYAQFLAGGTSYQTTIDGESSPYFPEETDFSIQPGVGVIFGLSETVGLELGADYRRVFVEDEGVNEFRAHVGVTFLLGSK